ncbi:MAG: sialidase family protein [Kofleriaceae bacterium]
MTAVVMPDAAVAPPLAGPCSSAAECAGGVCVEMPRDGQRCMPSCVSDADCHGDDRYVCDSQWHACTLPNTTALVAPNCPTPTGFGRDPAFAPPTALTTTGTQTQPSAVVADDGTLIALYLAEANTLAIARIDLANRLETVALPATTASEPRLARDARGKLYAVWISAGRDVMLATSDDRGTTWSAPRVASDPEDCASTIGVCVSAPVVIAGIGPRKEAIVYVAYAADGMRVRASRDGGATFAAAKTPLAGNRGNLAIGSTGLLYVVAINGGPRGEYGSGDHRIEFAASGDGGASFTRPQGVSRYGEMLPFAASNPSIVVDDKRKWIYLAYTRGGRDAKWDLVIVASKDFGKTWTRARIGDDPACAIHMVPNLALDPLTGALHAAWYDSRGLRFAHAVCLPGAVGCRQVGRINDTPLAALSLARGLPRSVGESEALVVDSARRTLHAVWAQPIDDAGRIVARVMHARARLK